MNKSLKLMGLAFILWFGVAASANATTTFSGFTSNAFGWGAVFGNDDITGAFSDDFFFQLPAPIAQNGGASVISGFGPQAAAFNVEFDSFELFNDTAGGPAIASGTPALGGSLSTFLFTQPSSSDVYRLHLEGNLASGALLGDYAGTLTISPVPEPETYAMLLVGLGLLGFAARRRSRTSI